MRLESRRDPLKLALRWRENRRLASFFVGIFTFFPFFWRETDRDVEAWRRSQCALRSKTRQTDRRHPAHQNNPGTAHDTYLACVLSRKRVTSRRFFLLRFDGFGRKTSPNLTMFSWNRQNLHHRRQKAAKRFSFSSRSLSSASLA
jgi:hypothetical protein